MDGQLSYLKDGSRIVGIKLPTGINILEDKENDGYIVEFSKSRYKSMVLLQIRNTKKTTIGFGFDKKEKEWIINGLNECDKLGKQN
jgi:spore maturation protein CgeB